MSDIEKAIEVLKMDNELMQFDPNTGEDYPIELQSEINKDIYKANLVAISALEKQTELNDAFKNSQKKLEKALDDLLKYKDLEEQGLLRGRK